jgi:hypothetical protein
MMRLAVDWPGKRSGIVVQSQRLFVAFNIASLELEVRYLKTVV